MVDNNYGAAERGDAILLASEILGRSALTLDQRAIQADRALSLFDMLAARGTWFYVDEHPEPQDYLFHSFDTRPLDPAREAEGWICTVQFTHYVAAGTVCLSVSVDHPDHAALEPNFWFSDRDAQLDDVVLAVEQYRWGDPIPAAWLRGRVVEFGDAKYDETVYADDL